MKRRMVWCCLLALGVIPTPATQAVTIFESATLGETGIPYSELTNQNVPGTNINSAVFAGVRFHLDQPVVTSAVGGHFVAPSTLNMLFGAIVALNDENDFPDSGDFTTPDFVGATVLNFPTPSAEVFGDLELTLQPGWYALVFGGGLFGAQGGGAAPRNNTDIGSPTYIAFGSGWSDVTPIAPKHRFVLNGVIVPEPCTILLLMFTGMPVFRRRKVPTTR